MASIIDKAAAHCAANLHRHSFLLQDELQAAFDIRRLREFRLGAHSVERGYIVDDECIELFLKHDTWFIPTLAISHLTPDQANNDWEKRWVRQRNMAHARGGSFRQSRFAKSGEQGSFFPVSDGDAIVSRP